MDAVKLTSVNDTMYTWWLYWLNYANYADMWWPDLICIYVKVLN